MKITNVQTDSMTFMAKGESGHWVVMDSKEENHGHDGAARPMELVLMGLAGCTGMDVSMILNKMRVEHDGFEIDVEAERAEEHPKVFTRIHVTYRFKGTDLPLAKLEKAVKLSAETYCSVSAMLAKTAEVTHEVVVETA